MKETTGGKDVRKKKHMLQIALNIFAKEGYHGTDVQVVADMAGVGKGTVYRHFGNKKELFLATARHCVDELGVYVRGQIGEAEAAEILDSQGAGEVLRRIAISCAEFYRNNPQAVEIMILERAEFRESVFPTHLMHRAETREGLEQFIAEAIARGEFRRLDPASVTDGLADLIFGAVVNGCLEGGAIEVDRPSQFSRRSVRRRAACC